MRRSVLLTLAALGGLVSLIGGVGLFSALTDTARTGTNSAESRALGSSADIALGQGTPDPQGVILCGNFLDNQPSGYFSVSNVGAGFTSAVEYFCIANSGSQPVALSALVDELVDVEVACTGDEELSGDTTCAIGQAGELADALAVMYASYPTCLVASGSVTGGPSLRNNATTPEPLGTLGPGDIRCLSVQLLYASNHPTDVVQKAQSDRVTWRFRFDAQA